MDHASASEHLQVIRTLMERAAVYRRALAPIMLASGALGVVAAISGIWLQLESMRAFGCLWLSTAAVAVAGAFGLARRQAVRDGEPFWSPPTRRVAQALLPALTSGFFLGLIAVFVNAGDGFDMMLALLWMLFYGCASHAAGFFMVRGIRLFGWLFIIGTLIIFGFLAVTQPNLRGIHAHLVMGVFFGCLHLTYGGYLYATENRKLQV